LKGNPYAMPAAGKPEEYPIMCEANAYLMDGDGEKLVMEAVDTVEPSEDGIRLINIFGDQKFLKARIHSLFLVDHKVLLQEISLQEDP